MEIPYDKDYMSQWKFTNRGNIRRWAEEFSSWCPFWTVVISYMSQD